MADCEDDEEDPEESGEEDPVNGQIGKEYAPKTAKGKEMARMLKSFCHLSKSSANTIVVYFGVSPMDKLADFCEEHWEDMFVQWQKHHTCSVVRSECLSFPHHNKIGFGVWHGPAIITVNSSGPLVHFCCRVTPSHIP